MIDHIETGVITDLVIVTTIATGVIEIETETETETIVTDETAEIEIEIDAEKTTARHDPLQDKVNRIVQERPQNRLFD